MSESGPKPNRLFTTCDQDIVRQDASHFTRECARLMDLYAGTKTTDADEQAAKVVCMSAIIGFATGMMEHFGVGIESFAGLPATDKANQMVSIVCAKKTLQRVQEHTDAMASLAEKRAN